MKRDMTFWMVLTVSLIAIIPLACIDFAMAWLVTKPISPAIFIYYVLPYLFIILPFVIIRFNKQKMWLVIAFLFFVVLIYYMPWSSRKVFLRDLYSIKSGMSITEVERRMSRYIIPFEDDMPNDLIPTSSDISWDVVKEKQSDTGLVDQLVYRHSNNGLFNADLGIVHFKNGLVESVEFMTD